MFVRTKTCKADDHRQTLNFSLVESVRVAGKPRQQFIIGLGSIDVSHHDGRLPAFWLKTPDGSGYLHEDHLVRFWDNADIHSPGIAQRLDELDVTPAERRAIIKSICQSVPAKPTKAQIRVGDADRTPAGCGSRSRANNAKYMHSVEAIASELRTVVSKPQAKMAVDRLRVLVRKLCELADV